MTIMFSRREIDDSIKRCFQAKQATMDTMFTLSQIAESLEKGKDEVSKEYRRCLELSQLSKIDE